MWPARFASSPAACPRQNRKAVADAEGVFDRRRLVESNRRQKSILNGDECTLDCE